MASRSAWFVSCVAVVLVQGFELHGHGDGVELESVVESTRQLLKMVRIWKMEHAAEVSLAKCVAVHLKGISTANWEDLERDSFDETTIRSLNSICDHRKKVFRALRVGLVRLYRSLAEYKFLPCFGRYLFQKFLEWIDGEP